RAQHPRELRVVPEVPRVLEDADRPADVAAAQHAGRGGPQRFRPDPLAAPPRAEEHVRGDCVLEKPLAGPPESHPDVELFPRHLAAAGVGKVRQRPLVRPDGESVSPPRTRVEACIAWAAGIADRGRGSRSEPSLSPRIDFQRSQASPTLVGSAFARFDRSTARLMALRPTRAAHPRRTTRKGAHRAAAFIAFIAA
ncbi:hypothetical protein THAOC_13525, partial [Thalassiosira oceanica]